jgi:F420-dependent oxidoreductase-like protein
MKLGVHLGQSGATLIDPTPLALEAERLGFDSAWFAESYGSDAVSVSAWVAARTTRIAIGTAVAQIPARTPATTAMTALTIDHLSGGRFRLGLGVSSPTVSEGWHGVPFDRPLTRTREYVAIVREIVRRERPLEYKGKVFELPLRGGVRSRPLKSILHPLRPEVPIYLAAIAPNGVALAAEVADGWIPAFYAPERADVFTEALERGLARAGRKRRDLEVAPMVAVHVGNDIDACRVAVKRMLALYVGGMGSQETNFYADLVTRYGYGEATEVIQRLYASGQREQAVVAVPDALVDEVALVGPQARIAERLRVWESSGVDTLIASTTQPEALRVLAETVT